MIFAYPPYFLSGNGITYSAGKMIYVNKGQWDKKSIKEKRNFNKKWIRDVRKYQKMSIILMNFRNYQLYLIIVTYAMIL